MKFKVWFGIGVSVLIFGLSYLFFTSLNNAVVKSGPGEHPGWQAQYLEMKGDENGEIPKGLIWKWHQADLENQKLNKSVGNLENVSELGPFNVGGRTRALLIDQADENHIVAGGISGGIWNSYNGGVTWTRSNDLSPTLSVTALTQSPFNNDVMYYSTGEVTGNSSDMNGYGIFKSIDGGDNFDILSASILDAFEETWDIKHSLVFDNTIYVGTAGNGLYMSDDGGLTFSKIYSTSRDIHEIKVFEDSIITIGISGYGIMRAHENDYNFIRLNSSPWPSSGYSRITYDYSKDFPDVIHAHLMNSNDNDIAHHLKSSDRGTTWQSISVSGLQNADLYPFPWYCLRLKLSPTDSNFIISSSLGGIYSTNGGSNWSYVEESHADWHNIAFTSNGNTIYSGNDGGVYRYSRASLGSSVIDRNSGYNVTQFYAGYYYPAGTSVICGTQDNGTFISQNSNPNFTHVLGGDGSFCAVSQQNANKLYASSQYLNLRKSNDAGNNFFQISNSLRSQAGGQSQTWFINPITINNVDDDQVYVPTRNGLFRTTNGGSNWTEMTTSVLGDPFTVAITDEDDPILYMGGSGSVVYRMENAKTSTTDNKEYLSTTAPNIFRSSFIECIEIHPNDPNTIFVALSNISANPRVWRIDDCDTDPKWTDLSGNLPSTLPVNWIEVDPLHPDFLIIGTDLGLYTSTNGGGWWEKEIRMPNTAIPNIRLRDSDRKLFVFTHGRGVFTADLAANPTSGIGTVKREVTLYPNPATSIIKIESNTFKAIEIFGVDGKLLASFNDQNVIDVSGIARGIVMVRIIYEDGSVALKKVNLI